MTGDVVQRLRTLIRQLLDYVEAKEGREEKEEEAVAALEELSDWTDDLNISIDFMKARTAEICAGM